MTAYIHLSCTAFINYLTVFHEHLGNFQFLIMCVSHSVKYVTPWTAAHQAPLCMEFPRQEYWSGWPFPSPRDLPNPGIKPRSPALQVDSLPSETPQKPFYHVKSHKINSLEPRIFFCIGRTGPGTNLIGSMTEWSSSLLKPH